MKKILLFLLSLSALTSYAYDVCVDGIYYYLDLSNHVALVTYGENQYSGAIIIPETIKYEETNFTVTRIGYQAFENSSDLTSVTIGNFVTEIGEGAFSGCSGLTSIAIPNSVTSIGDRAFYNCSGLTSIAIPNSVTRIGEVAFMGCSSLTSVTIPNSVTIIGASTFAYCSSLTSITISNSVTSIAEYAFINCSGLTSVTIPNSVTSINWCAFEGCSNVKELIYAEGTENVIRTGIRSISSITIPNSVTSIGSSAFSDCSSLTSITIPNSVTSIGSSAFSDCSSLTSITIPNSVTSIKDFAFDGCHLQTVITKGNVPAYIEGDTFSSKTEARATLYIPNGTYWDYAYTTGCWYEFNNCKEFAAEASNVKTDKAYMIADASGRNYTVCENGNVEIVEYAHQLDEDNLGTYWQIQQNGTHNYLYSPAAKSYATMKNGEISLTTAPVDIELNDTDADITINGTKSLLVLNTNPNIEDAIQSIKDDSSISSRSNYIYDLQGRRVNKTGKGLYIENGKKVLY